MKKQLKWIYSQLPFKKELFKVVKKLWSPPPSIYRHLHFKDVFNAQVSPSENFKIRHYGFEVENEIFWKGLNGGWEKTSIDLWVKLSRQSSVVLDIGANTGVYSLIAKTVNPKAKVFAFEPVERVYNKLVDNCKLNEYDITCYMQAVSNYSGTAVIYDTCEEHIYSVTVNKNIHSTSTHVKQAEISVVSLKKFIEENTLHQIDLIKIDVETHEPEVLEGFSDYLAQFKPTILIEILSNEVGAKVDELLHGLDYLYFYIDDHKGLQQTSQITRRECYNYLICTEQVAQKLNLIDERNYSSRR